MMCCLGDMRILDIYLIIQSMDIECLMILGVFLEKNMFPKAEQ